MMSSPSGEMSARAAPMFWWLGQPPSTRCAHMRRVTAPAPMLASTVHWRLVPTTTWRCCSSKPSAVGMQPKDLVPDLVKKCAQVRAKVARRGSRAGKR